MSGEDSFNCCCKKCEKNHYKIMLENLFWPAAAGNVFWAFFQVFVEEWLQISICTLARLFPLFLLGVYLTMDWLRTQHREDNEIDCIYLVADLIFISGIVVFAIATQSHKFWPEPRHLEYSLGIIFLIAAAGHVFGVWDRTNEGHPGRSQLAITNLLGPLVLWLSYVFFDEPYPWNLTVALFVVITIWLFSNAYYRS